ncbi:MAG: hypothetical protein AB7E72_06395 [Lysobacterales bacterium]
MSAGLPSSPESDFDFIIGDWRVRHRRLKHRLAGCTEWQEFDGISSTRKILGERGNVEDNLLHPPEGTYRAAAFRSLDVASGQWAIWWLDGRSPHHLDTPVVGRFSDGQGRFYADDTLEGRPIRVRFLWLPVSADAARWEQAFSADAGQTWETNWTMDFERTRP